MSDVNMNNAVDLENRDLVIPAPDRCAQSTGTPMAIPDRLQVFLFEKLRDEVVEFLLGKETSLVELVEAEVPLRAVAGTARPYLVVNLTYVIAGCTFVIDGNGFGDDMLHGETGRRAAVNARPVVLHELPVLAGDVGPLLGADHELAEGFLDKAVMLPLGRFAVRHVEGALGNDLCILVVNQMLCGLNFPVRHPPTPFSSMTFSRLHSSRNENHRGFPPFDRTHRSK